MNPPRIPLAAVVVVGALIVSGPVALSLEEGVYRETTPGGLVIHHHAHDHPVRLGESLDNEPELKAEVSQARAEWDLDLDKVEVPLVNSNPEINFKRMWNCGSNAVLSFTSGYHPDAEEGEIPTAVDFNGCETQDLTRDQMQGYACRVIGKILGLKEATDNRFDCMKNPDQHSHVSAASAGYVDEFFGPTINGPSGSLYANRTNLSRTASYSFTASASGHAMESVRVLLNGQEMEQEVRTPGPCTEHCTVTVTWPVPIGKIPPGPNTVTVVARNEFGVTDTLEFEALVVDACDKYVAMPPSGNDSNEGTFGQPYATLGKLLVHLTAGQTGCFRGGVYAFEDLANVNKPNITLRPYGSVSGPPPHESEEVTLKGPLRVLRPAVGATIQGFVLDGDAATTNYGPQIYADDVVLRDNEITNHDAPATCIEISKSGSPPQRPLNVRLEGNDIHDCGTLDTHHGVYVHDALRAVIRDNWFYENAGRGVQLSPDADETTVTGNTIDGNNSGLNFSCDLATCSQRNTAVGNVISNSDNWNVYGFTPLVGGATPDRSNVLRGTCVHVLSTADEQYQVNGGVQPSSPFFTEDPEDPKVIANPAYVDRASQDLHLTRLSPCLAAYTGTMSLP